MAIPEKSPTSVERRLLAELRMPSNPSPTARLASFISERSCAVSAAILISISETTALMPYPFFSRRRNAASISIIVSNSHAVSVTPVSRCHASIS